MTRCDGIWRKPRTPPVGRDYHGHPVMNPQHVPIGSGGDDRGLQVIADPPPDPGKGQRQAIHPLEVEGLSVAGAPLVKAAGRNEASVLTECIAETGQGVHGLGPGIEERSPARCSETPYSREHAQAMRAVSHNGNR